TQIYKFHGGDGNDHRILNHNLLLKTYPGAIGVKTGYTRHAGHSLIAAATRDGRTMLAVLPDAPAPHRFPTGLLDQAFATPSGAGPPAAAASTCSASPLTRPGAWSCRPRSRASWPAARHQPARSGGPGSCAGTR